MNLRVRIVHPFSDMVADSVFVRRGGGGDGRRRQLPRGRGRRSREGIPLPIPVDLPSFLIGGFAIQSLKFGVWYSVRVLPYRFPRLLRLL